MPAVLFDLGGVILESPIPVVASVEREYGIPPGGLVPILTGKQSSFAGLMRGEVTTERFDELLAVETAGLGSRPVRGLALLSRFEEAVTVRPSVLDAAIAIRASGMATGVVTNNWHKLGTPDDELAEHFDVFVESWTIGIAKPDPGIYLEACRRLGVDPPEVVFLDDFGENLQTARDLGMTTIRVADPGEALLRLGEVVGPERLVLGEG